MKETPNMSSPHANEEEQNGKKKKKKFSLYQLFYGSGNGRGVDRSLIEGPRNVKNFFLMCRAYFTQLFTVNLLMVFGNFPLFFGLYALTGNLNTYVDAPASSLYPLFYGMQKISGITPQMLPFLGVHSAMVPKSVTTTATIVMALLTLLVIFTWGIVNVGTSYILRNMVRGEPIFVWQDFWYAVRRNYRQAIPMGILDLGVIAILFYNITLSYFNMSVSSVSSFVFFSNIILAFLYFVMRFYLYIMMVTFDLKISKLLKNAFLFVFLGMKRNALAITGIGLLMALDYLLLGILMPLAVMLPLILLFAIGAFMAAYAAYPKIREIMIDPYYESDLPGAPEKSDADEKPDDDATDEKPSVAQS